MGLYLAVFASSEADQELDGVEVGSYDDFHSLRQAVARELESGAWGSRFPIFMLHADSDGEWTLPELLRLAIELEAIERELATRPSPGFADGSWQKLVAISVGAEPTSLGATFIDVDGEPLIPRLRRLVETAIGSGAPVSFQ